MNEQHSAGSSKELSEVLALVDGGCWEQIPATYCDRIIWKNGPRLKIFITVDGFPKARYVHPLSVIRATAQQRDDVYTKGG